MKSQVQAALAALVVSMLVLAFVVGHAAGTVAGLAVGACGMLSVAGYGWWSLRRGRHTPWEVARTLVAPGHAVVFWKPGCPHCERLLRALGADADITWVNVWQDAAANRVVRDLNDGNEYTPTVLVGDEVLRNPDAAAVRARLGH